MKRIKLGLILFSGVLLIMAAGCATMSTQKDDVISLKNQIVALETKVQQKDAEIDSLRKALSQTTEEKYAAAKRTSLQAEATTKPTTRQIQTALKNAGYDPGPIDGRMGKATRTAIKEFQKANNLGVDGKVGKQTWSVLGQYLDKGQTN
jgi:peptidoglycan hydrolase-like protein with peptidoglycan-binding domain